MLRLAVNDYQRLHNLRAHSFKALRLSILPFFDKKSFSFDSSGSEPPRAEEPSGGKTGAG